MLNILLAIHLIIAVLLIILVLMQRSEGGGLGIGGGGNNGKSASLGKLDGLQKATWALGSAFLISSIVLTIVAANTQGNSSVLDQLDGVSAADINAADEGNASDEVESTSVPSDPNASTGTPAPADPNASQ